MAGAATAQHLRVVNRNRGLPHKRAVAVFANVRRLNMCGTLSCCSNAVVAANAITENVGMVEDGGEPRGCVVAVVALVAGGDVHRCLARRLGAVMAGNATPGYGCVIHESDCAPTRGNMTVGARSECHHMIGGF